MPTCTLARYLAIPRVIRRCGAISYCRGPLLRIERETTRCGDYVHSCGGRCIDTRNRSVKGTAAVV